MATATETRAIVDRLHREVFQNGNIEHLDEIVAEGFVVHGPDGDQGRDEHFRQVLPVIRGAFPDLEFSFEDKIDGDDRVASRFIARGTHQGDFMGTPPTGNRVTIEGLVIDRVENGKVVESWVQRNDLAMMQQLGLIPAPE